MTRLVLFLLALAAFAAPRASAQPSVIDFGQLDRYFGEEPSVEVNLRGSLLRLAAAATREDEPDTADLIDALNAITVRIYPLSSALSNLDQELGDLGRQFEADGWETFVRVRDTGDDGDADDVWIYVREDGTAFGGLVVMALDESEDQAAFVVIDGHIEPDQIGRLARFGSVNLMGGDDDDN